jgi:hypothetical protein
MPIIRGAHDFDESFTRMPNRWLRDQRLSLKTIGLLAQLHSHSVGWRLSLRSLAEANQCGIDLIRTAITELESAGYLKREQARTEDNRFAESVWTTVDPSSGFPSSENPSSEKPYLKKINVKKTNLKKHMPSLTRFDEFWDNYPRKVGKNSARKAYEAARGRYEGSVGDYEAMVISGALRLSQDRNLPDLQYVPYPTTWLNRDGWNDDPYPERKLTAEELAERAKVQRDLKRAQDLADTKKLLQEKRVSAPAPICEHGAKIVSCRKCLRSQPNGARND